MELYENREETDLNTLINCSPLKDINSLQKEGIEAYLQNRIVKFQEVKREDLNFIQKFLETFSEYNSPILKKLLNTSSQALVSSDVRFKF